MSQIQKQIFSLTSQCDEEACSQSSPLRVRHFKLCLSRYKFVYILRFRF